MQVINNLNRYSKEPGANEELVSLIIISLEDWDNKMQIECAQSFITPLKNNVRPLINYCVSCLAKITNKEF